MRTNFKTNALLLLGILLSFQDALSQEAVNDPCSQPPLSQKQRDEYNAEAKKELKKIKDQIEQQFQEAAEKAHVYEKEIKYSKGAITEKDQLFVDLVTEWRTSRIFRSESGAILYIKILLKGDHNSFRFFKRFSSEQERKSNFDYAIEAALSRIKSSNKNAADLAGEVIRRGNDYPRAAREAFRIYQ